MKIRSIMLLVALIAIVASCNQKKNEVKNMKYSSAITFLYYKNFTYGADFVENTLQLELVADKGFARVYRVNEKAFLGIVQAKDSIEIVGNTLFSLTTSQVEKEYERVKKLEVFNLTGVKRIESIPLTSFFFDDAEGHKFEIQQFHKEEDVQLF